MILLLDTSTPTAKLTLINENDESVMTYEWQAERQLAKGLLAWLGGRLKDNELSWQDIKGIGVFRGPGSFTGIRIGLTVLNTLADSLTVPIVGTMGDSWQQAALDRLNHGENDKLALPYYDRDANITLPRK